MFSNILQNAVAVLKAVFESFFIALAITFSAVLKPIERTAMGLLLIQFGFFV